MEILALPSHKGPIEKVARMVSVVFLGFVDIIWKQGCQALSGSWQGLGGWGELLDPDWLKPRRIGSPPPISIPFLQGS